MICVKAKLNKGKDKVAYFANKKLCCLWLNLQNDLKSCHIHFYDKAYEDVDLHGKYDIDLWIEKNG